MVLVFGYLIIQRTRATATANTTPEDSDYINLQLLGWSSRGKTCTLLLEGLQTSSPYAGLKGTYVGRIEVAKGVAQEVACLLMRAGARSHLKLTHGRIC